VLNITRHRDVKLFSLYFVIHSLYLNCYQIDVSSQSHITTDNQSPSPSWCQAPIWDPGPIFLSPRDFLLDSYCLLFYTLNGRNIPFVNSAKYLGVLFDMIMTWRLHIQTIEAKAFRTFIRIYSLFKSERLSADFKLTLHKTLIRSVMTYACPAWKFAAECHLLKLQRLQNKVLRTIGNFPKRTSVRDMHKSFHMPYFYDYITKSCRQQLEWWVTILIYILLSCRPYQFLCGKSISSDLRFM
jgi:hypothetical protein